MASTSTNPLFTRTEKKRVRRKIAHKIKGAARSGFARLFGIPLSQGLGGTSKSASRSAAHRKSQKHPSSPSGQATSSSVRGDVISALRGQGYSRSVAEKMAPAAHAGDSFESLFRRAMAKNPGELLIFGNPAIVYTRKKVAGAVRRHNGRAHNFIPTAVLQGLGFALGEHVGGKALTSGKSRRNTDAVILGSADLRRRNMAFEWMADHWEEYASAQMLAQAASTKYDFPVSQLLHVARQLFAARENPGSHRHNAGCGNLVCFHGAFKDKAKAVAKEGKTPGAFTKNLRYGAGDYRWTVLTPRNKNVGVDTITGVLGSLPTAVVEGLGIAVGEEFTGHAIRKRLLKHDRKIQRRNPDDFRAIRHRERVNVQRALRAAGYKARVKHGRGTAHAWLDIRIDGRPFTESDYNRVKEIAAKASGRSASSAEHIGVDFDLRRGNPGSLDRAEDLFQRFHRRGASGAYETQRSAKLRKDFTILGPLVAIGINAEEYDRVKSIGMKARGRPWEDYKVEHWDRLPHLAFLTGSQVAHVKRILGEPEKYVQNCPQLASSPGGKQLYAITPDGVEIDLRQFDTDTRKDFIDLGEATFVVYIAKKPDEPLEWVHELGEDGGIRPRLMFDRLKREIFFIGGSYKVEAPGILN